MGLLRDGREGVAALFQRRRRTPVRVPLDPQELGLAAFPPRGVLLQFSSPGSMPSRVSLNRLAAAVAACPDEAVVIELSIAGSHRMAARLGVRQTPTVLYVDDAGEVLLRWTRPPAAQELESVLAEPLAVVR
jgi:hypothetical protein